MRNDARPIGEEFRDIAEHQDHQDPENAEKRGPAERAHDKNTPFVVNREPGDDELPTDASERWAKEVTMTTAHTTIAWQTDLENALNDARAGQRLVILDFSAAPMWSGCARLDAEVYSDDQVARFINELFVPVRVHVRDQADEFKRLGKRYNVQWTPTILVLDAAGEERHRVEGFLPSGDFIPQLALGRAKAAFANSDFAEAERRFREVVDRYPSSDAAPDALYWAGVSRYKATGDASALKETARQFRERYVETAWAKKASVWG
jgi:hypothetical protein